MTEAATEASSPPVATTERLDPVFLHSGEPFTVLYGPGVGDLFVDSAYQVCPLEQSLWRLLRAEGFERVVFSSLQHPLYFRDRASRDLSRSGGAARGTAAPGSPRRRTMRHPRLRGPLDGLLVRDFGPGSAPDPPGNRQDETGATDGAGRGDTGGPPAAPPAGVSDPFGVMTLAGYLRRPGQRTAVVFPHTEEILQHTRAARQLADAMAAWADHADDRNQWILVFRKPTLEEVADFVRLRGGFPLLDAFVSERRSAPGRSGTFRIGHPQAAELERLVHAVRLEERMGIADWRELDAVVRAMAAGHGTVRSWRARLRHVARTEGALSSRIVRQWVGTVTEDARTPWERLAALPGLDQLKQHVDQLRAEVEADEELRAAGRLTACEPPALHLVFTGNPGTGKTTAARLIGEIYRDLGLLSRGHLVEASISDLVAGYVGQTSARTEETVDRALDGVLFVDEAYGLSDQRDGFGDQAVQTLLKRMEDDRGRLVVVVAGYPDKMREFLAANPGLESRFPQHNVIAFPDYPPATLHTILLQRLAERGLQLAPGTEDRLREIVTEMHRTRGENFANARDMRTLADAVRKQWVHRIRREVAEPVTPEDIPEPYRAYLPRPAPDPADLLAGLDAYVGLGPVREELENLANRLRMRQALNKGGLAPPHLLFTGPPGTGKTTVARLTGRLFRELGLLRKGHVVEATRTDLVAGFVGQTAPLVRRAVHDALDGVLFIDEAYSLVRDTGGQGGFGAEAIDTLVREMEEWRGRLVVIAAGYPRDMDRLLDANPGLRSRFTARVPFPEYSPEDLVEILRRMAAAEGYRLGEGVAERATRWLLHTRRADPASFGNARTVRGLLGTMEGRMAARFAKGAADPEFLPEDVPGPPVTRTYGGA
ncbi:AAA family ATPase [Streptomyces sp. AA8]|nr:AAA family ATPase [Streptomyces telluris]NJP79085.1 AAA family ATPase [Streptomyces telluris]